MLCRVLEEGCHGSKTNARVKFGAWCVAHPSTPLPPLKVANRRRDTSPALESIGTSTKRGRYCSMFALGPQFPKFAIALILAMASSSGNARELPVEMGLMTCSFAASSTSPSADPEDLIGGRRDIECSFRLGLNGPDET